MAKSRGVVLSVPFDVIPTGGLRCGGGIPSSDLRKYLLYWDKIDYPDNNLISIGTDADFQFLINAEIATRTLVRFQGPVSSGNGEFFLVAQEKAFEKHETEEPGLWSLAQQSTSLHFVNAHSAKAIEFELWNLLPVPQADVPLNEILEFKAKRSDQLIALRTYLDELYEFIISASDIPRARNTQLAKLEVALQEIDRVLSESGIRKTLSSLRGFIASEISNSAGIGLGAAGLASVVDMTPWTAGIVGAGINFAVKSVLCPRHGGTSNPLTYVKSIRRDL